MMENKMLVIGLVLMAGMAFAMQVPAPVDTMMQKAWCSYDTDGNLFDDLASDIMGFDGSYEGQLNELGNDISDEWDAMHNCFRGEDISVSEYTPEEIQRIACVSSHYSVLNGYMSQVKMLYFRAAFENGAFWPEVLGAYRSYQSDWSECLQNRPS